MQPGVTTSDVIVGGMQDNGTWFTDTDAEYGIQAGSKLAEEMECIVP
ncbi:MAG: hypothetical protein IPO32_19470 [Crocinitomicaceae bacterium]|nr:hypothetical protein [Crocinitomicaceae bacterium]